MFNFMAIVYLTLRHENSSVVNIDHMINYLGSMKPLVLHKSQQTAKSGLLPSWGSVVVLCFDVRYFVFILVMQSS